MEWARGRLAARPRRPAPGRPRTEARDYGGGGPTVKILDPWNGINTTSCGRPGARADLNRTGPRPGAERRERTCKPDSVPPQGEGGDHFSRAGLAPGLERPTRGRRGPSPSSPYSVFLRVGFALPALSPGPRCALTAPFHPYRPTSVPGDLGRGRLAAPRATAVCFLWHFPWPRGRLPLATTLAHGARTFLPGDRSPRRPPGPLARWDHSPPRTGRHRPRRPSDGGPVPARARRDGRRGGAAERGARRGPGGRGECGEQGAGSRQRPGGDPYNAGPIHPVPSDP